ncbi:polymerase [Leptospira adleri]|uniref:Polymerase n=2 Tax=Leptospira adleri TaxID=2023186 RepID=A0A2M9YM96_9LEPT|nr:polymerase [Leptospira adleri]PJZ60955.1 polymerase [Leptospira adleri]
MISTLKPRMSDSLKNFTDSLLKDLEENENAFFKIENEDGLAYLSVFPAGKKGKSVDSKEILRRIELFQISEISHTIIKELVLKSDGLPHLIGKWPGKPESSRIEIEISEDKMKAFILFHPPKYGGKILSSEQIQESIQLRGIEYGILQETIDRISAEPEYGKKIQIAEGTAPIPGKNGDVRILFIHPATPHLEEDQFGRVDFKNIQIIQSVAKDQKLAEKISPAPGKEGKNVFGEILPYEPGKEAEWKLGANVRLSLDGTSVHSLISGRPILDRQGTIRVDEVCHLENVDFSTGNVSFPGTIIVEGSIADGFTLETEGSIIVKKSVGKVFLKAGGDIVLSGGFMGRNGGLIESGADIYTRFVEQGRLISKNTIFIEEASMHSELVAGESVVIRGGRGELIGGTCVAGKAVICTKLGAIAETKTSVSVGIRPELLEDLEKLRSEVQKNQDILKKVELSLVKLNEDSQRRQLTAEEKESLPKLTAIKLKYSGILNNLLGQEQSMIMGFEPDKDSYVEVEQEIFPGVDIYPGKGKNFKVRLKEIPGPSFVFLGNDGNPQITKVRPKRLGILQEEV